ncbi:MAG: response regulator [Campylobacterales bacterium]|nr:response regulator [Campylobacterales bacterium]
MSKTVLIVDDASMIRNLASKTAMEAGYNVLTASDGTEGIEVLEANHVDLVFSDVNMPKMGGLEMVEKIKSKEQYKFLPIVMLTTEQKEELKQQGKALGVKAWLVKPFNKNKFLLALEKLLG